MQEPLEKTIERIKKMEDYFEKLSVVSEAALQNGKLPSDLDKMVLELTAYLESGQWLVVSSGLVYYNILKIIGYTYLKKDYCIVMGVVI